MLLYSMPDFSSGETWVGLLTLTFLEIVLGIDNIIFISILSNKLPESQQPRARNLGLILAMVLRIILLFGITIIIGLKEPLFHIKFLGLDGHVTGQSLILFLGGLFLLWKATKEIHHKLESPEEQDDPNGGGLQSGLQTVVMQIALINIVFSFDSILTAIGIADNLWIMVVAVVLSVLVMMVFSGSVSKFVNEHPTIQMLGLAFLILIGFSLIAEAAHLGHFIVSEIPKGYMYFAIFFSVFVEILNIRMKKVRKPIQLYGAGKTASEQGIIDQNILKKP